MRLEPGASACLLLGRLAGVLFAVSALLSASASAADIVVVLSSESAYYREALAGFQEAMGQTAVPVHLAAKAGPADTQARVVVAIGGKAALGLYPEGSTLVYCMAPGVLPEADGRTSTVRIETMPPPRRLLLELRQLQPSLVRLGVPWSSDAVEVYVRELQQAATELGIRVTLKHVDTAESMPSALRDLHGKVDALWVPLDPLLLDAESLDVLKNYSSANDVPFYASADGLVEHGAVASVSSPFREVGRLAAAAARQALDGEPLATVRYPELLQTVVDLRAAAECGLEVPPAALKNVHKVLP